MATAVFAVGLYVGPAQAKDRSGASASSRQAPVHDYGFCLAYQQAAWDPHDRVAEACTWTVANHAIARRLRLAIGGNLTTWVTELADEQGAADLRHPQFMGLYPDVEHRQQEGLRFDPSWMEGRRKPIVIDAARQMLAQVLYEEARDGIVPEAAPPIRWSKPFNRDHWGPKATRLLVTLSYGRTSYAMRTGHEQALLTWMLTQPDRSITLESMFRAGYRLADGDVFRALLTIENVLSRDFLDPKRNQLEHIVRLAPITNTWDDRGDHFGAWYHLWGLVLFTYAHGGWPGQVACSAETFGSHVSSPRREVEPQEDRINQAGVRLGAFLRRYVKGEGWNEHVDDPSALDADRYMDLDEFPVYRSTQ